MAEHSLLESWKLVAALLLWHLWVHGVTRCSLNFILSKESGPISAVAR